MRDKSQKTAFETLFNESILQYPTFMADKANKERVLNHGCICGKGHACKSLQTVHPDSTTFQSGNQYTNFTQTTIDPSKLFEMTNTFLERHGLQSASQMVSVRNTTKPQDSDADSDFNIDNLGKFDSDDDMESHGIPKNTPIRSVKLQHDAHAIHDSFMKYVNKYIRPATASSNRASSAGQRFKSINRPGSGCSQTAESILSGDSTAAYPSRLNSAKKRPDIIKQKDGNESEEGYSEIDSYPYTKANRRPSRIRSAQLSRRLSAQPTRRSSASTTRTAHESENEPIKQHKLSSASSTKSTHKTKTAEPKQSNGIKETNDPAPKTAPTVPNKIIVRSNNAPHTMSPEEAKQVAFYLSRTPPFNERLRNRPATLADWKLEKQKGDIVWDYNAFRVDEFIQGYIKERAANEQRERQQRIRLQKTLDGIVLKKLFKDALINLFTLYLNSMLRIGSSKT